MPGTWVYDSRNFGLVEVTGTRADRRLTLGTLDYTGKQLWRHEITARDLGVPVEDGW